ncbi:MAG TPA: hypothetical protein VKU02_31180 [Gemmataceae bacterium]|nr:hypothetical protein [Gemmataceae bacterium]
MESSKAAGSDPSAVGGATSNGVAEQQTDASDADDARRQTMQRAEELADRLGEQVGQYVSALGHSVLKWVARAREEAEDIWAEAEAIRQRQRAADDSSASAPTGKG